ncbi:hypothetical protein BDR26DRAFT_869582 [Obelidium mucronatum]|nr:hypothetical protein BDR26DRAFT_869582 [Obelidium mucronatum]
MAILYTLEYDPTYMLKASVNLLMVGFLMRPCINLATRLSESQNCWILLTTCILLIINGLFAFLYCLFKLVPDLSSPMETRGILLFYSAINTIGLGFFVYSLGLRVAAFWQFSKRPLLVMNILIAIFVILKASRYLCYYPKFYGSNVDQAAITSYQEHSDGVIEGYYSLGLMILEAMFVYKFIKVVQIQKAMEKLKLKIFMYCLEVLMSFASFVICMVDLSNVNAMSYIDFKVIVTGFICANLMDFGTDMEDASRASVRRNTNEEQSKLKSMSIQKESIAIEPSMTATPLISVERAKSVQRKV